MDRRYDRCGFDCHFTRWIVSRILSTCSARNRGFIISKVIGTLFKESAPKAAAAVAAPAPAIDEESYAVLLAAVSEEARLSGEEFRVVSIKEL